MQTPILIDGVPFFAVSHHDGRFIRAPGLAALARQDPDGGYTILNFELCEAINRSAGPNHPRWTWALTQGLNTLLVHLAGHETLLPAAVDVCRAALIRWHIDAQAPPEELGQDTAGNFASVRAPVTCRAPQ
jgi:hypothetical protein